MDPDFLSARASNVRLDVTSETGVPPDVERPQRPDGRMQLLAVNHVGGEGTLSLTLCE
jgi:hypothetical protein